MRLYISSENAGIAEASFHAWNGYGIEYGRNASLRTERRNTMLKMIHLSELEPGCRACVCSIHTKSHMRRRLLDIGLIEDTEVTCLGRSPAGDPSAYLIRGAVIALRAADARDISVCIL